MKKLKFVIGTMFTILAVNLSWAQSQEPINIIVNLPAGGLTDRINLAIKDELEKNGYKTNVVRFDNCKGQENWLKNNTGKPAVFEYLLGNTALGMVDPGNPGACSVPLTEKTVLTINHQTQFQACSLRAAGDAADLWANGRGKLGITAAPDINSVMAEQIINDVNKNTQIVRYKGNPALLQALVSREVDFVGQFGPTFPVIQAGGTCFFTTADVAKASKNKQVSIDQYRKNSPVAGIGYMSITVGLNVDTDKLRPIVTNVVKNSTLFKQHFATGADMKGVPAGTTPAQQFKQVEDYLKYFKK
jgi:hypothetical protein